MSETKLKNIFKGISGNIHNEVFETILQNDKIKLERIISKGHITPVGKWYDQDFDEWLILLSGKAILSFMDQAENITLIPGDYMLIEAHKKHRVEYTSYDEETIWLTLHINK